MTALDEYLARERETLRAATPRPWQVEISDGYITGHITAREHRYSGNRVSRKDSVTGPDSMTTADAGLIVSAVNDREALLDALEYVAHRPTCGRYGEEYDASTSDICDCGLDAVLSRLTADSEGMTHV